MLYPTEIQSQSSNSSSHLDLFTTIFYTIRVLGATGVIRPSAIPSANGGIYLEQDIFTRPQDKNPSHPYLDLVDPSSLWSFSPSSIPGYYEWSLYSQPAARVAWMTGDTEDDFPLQLRNLTEVIQDIYEDPSSSLWDFERIVLQNGNKGHTIRPMNFGQISSLTLTPTPKSPRGWWLQLSKEDDVLVFEHVVLFQPQNYKLYATSAHMDLGDVDDILNTPRVKKYVRCDYFENQGHNDTVHNVTTRTEIEYDVFVQADKEFDIFAGITVINPNTRPSRKYFDLEGSKEDVLHLKGVADIVGVEEVEVEAFSNRTIASYVTYLKEFKGLGYTSWTDVTAVADMMSNGRVIKNVLVKDLNLLKHLIRGKGYRGKFWEIEGGVSDAARIRIKTRGVLRGSLPIPFVQFEEGDGGKGCGV